MKKTGTFDVFTLAWLLVWGMDVFAVVFVVGVLVVFAVVIVFLFKGSVVFEIGDPAHPTFLAADTTLNLKTKKN